MDQNEQQKNSTRPRKALSPRRIAVMFGLLLVILLPSAVLPQAAHADGAAIANIALGEVGPDGTGNPETNDGSGCNKYTGALYGHSTDCSNPSFGNRANWQWQWCADFATWVWKQAGVDVGGLGSTVHSFRIYGDNHGTYHPAGSYVPQPGDAILYGDAHIGIVVSSGKNPPDAVEGNDLVNGVYQVYLRHNATDDGGGVGVTGYVTPVGGSGGGGGGNPTFGQILGSSSRDMHSGPSGNTPQVDSIPNGATISIECVKNGQNVSGPYGSETIWDRTVYNGHLGYVSDAWVYTGTNSAAAPDCGGNGVVMTTPCQNLYATPSLSSKVLGCVPEAIAVTVDCTYTGDNVNGPYGAETLWDHITYGGSGFVPDAWIYTGTANPIAGTCSSIPTPPTAVSKKLPEAVVGQAYSTALTASGGTGSYFWTVQRGQLPPGLTLASNGTVTGTPTKNGTWTFGVQVGDAYGLADTATETIPVTHAGVAPTIALTAPTFGATTSSTVTVSWSGSDSGGPGLAHYQLRYMRAAYSSGFGAWSYPWNWQALRSPSLTQTGLTQGYDHCWSVRAIDKAGKASAWSSVKCTAVALDDRALATSTAGWTRSRATAWWNGTATTTKKLHARLTRAGAQADRLGLVATRCANCGTVGLYVGTTLIGKINLYARRTHHRQMIMLRRFRLRSGSVVLKTLTSGKTIQVDGLVISRT